MKQRKEKQMLKGMDVALGRNHDTVFFLLVLKLHWPVNCFG